MAPTRAMITAVAWRLRVALVGAHVWPAVCCSARSPLAGSTGSRGRLPPRRTARQRSGRGLGPAAQRAALRDLPSRARRRVSLRLLVEAGSLMENEQQRGLAHFLEHMAFKGSTNLPPGELIELPAARRPRLRPGHQRPDRLRQHHLPARPAAQRRGAGRREPGHPERDRRPPDCWPPTRSSPSAA